MQNSGFPPSSAGNSPPTLPQVPSPCPGPIQPKMRLESQHSTPFFHPTSHSPPLLYTFLTRFHLLPLLQSLTCPSLRLCTHTSCWVSSLQSSLTLSSHPAPSSLLCVHQWGREWAWLRSQSICSAPGTALSASHALSNSNRISQPPDIPQMRKLRSQGWLICQGLQDHAFKL